MNSKDKQHVQLGVDPSKLIDYDVIIRKLIDERDIQWEQRLERERQATAYVQSLLDAKLRKEAEELERIQRLEDQKREDKINADIRKACDAKEKQRMDAEEAEKKRQAEANKQKWDSTIAIAKIVIPPILTFLAGLYTASK